LFGFGDKFGPLFASSVFREEVEDGER